MRVEENLDSQITVVDAEEFENEITVSDDDTGDVGKVIARLPDGKLLVEWGDADESDTHNEMELFSIYAPNVTLLVQDEDGDVELIENPFGGWIAGKVSGHLKRRKATKTFGKRLKAEAALDAAREKEADALKRYRGEA